MNSHHIYVIEQTLKKLENTDESQLSERLTQFFNNVCNALDIPYNSQDDCDPRDDCGVLFRGKKSNRKKDFIAVCLLRLLGRNEEVIWHHKDFRTQTFDLFDKQIPSIYAHFKISENDQNHVKSQKLVAVEEIVLTSFYNITNSIVDLRSADHIRQDFMRTLNADLNKLFLHAFVTPKMLTNTNSIAKIFKAVEMYNQASSIEDKFVAFPKVEEEFNSFLAEAKKCRTILAKQCIIAPLEKIHGYIRDDFESNDAIKPTEVVISELDRKYPFHEQDRSIKLKFQVSNKGPGYAFDIQIECEEMDGLAPCDPENLGNLAPKDSSVIVLETTVKTASEKQPIVIGKLYWWNFDRSKQKTREFIFELKSQPANLDWDNLKSKQPYSLEPINEAKNLVGRTKLMQQLRARLSADRIGSSIIHGQKRVGKTSIAEVLKANFEINPSFSVVSVPIISLDTTTPESLVADLGTAIVNEVSDTSTLFTHLENPEFGSALAPLRNFFRDAKKISPNHRFIIILDEFDEIPPDMVQGGGVGQTFFNNIRAISSMGYVGFVLVGGENMQIVTGLTQQQLNKMSPFQVDYFDKGQYWADFQDLVQQPTEKSIEFNSSAINALYEMTEGHPYYTKVICSEIYSKACENRNAFISEDNVEQAVQLTIESLDLNAVSHLWIDGINRRYDQAQSDDIQTTRRKFLIAFAQTKRRKDSISKEDLCNSNILKDVDNIDRIMENYINRGFLIEESDRYRWKPRIFERWLIEHGFSMLTGEFLNESEIIRMKEEEEKAYVLDSEIVELCDNWDSYRGAPITPPHVRTWLEQFEYNTEQRLMFTLLKHVKFFGQFRIREKIRELHEEVQKIIAGTGVARPWDRRLGRSDILLSSLESSPAKSGASYARIYAKENNIPVNNVVPRDHIQVVLNDNNQISAIVFVDDIIASGDSVRGYLNELNELCGKLIRDKQLMILVCAVCGHRRGLDKVQDAAADALLSEQVRIVVGDILDETNQCFSNQSEVFTSPGERDKAKDIAEEYGRKLVKNAPLGYNDGQLLVVFHDNCPNNTLPILWKESTGKIKWRPLFRRN